MPRRLSTATSVSINGCAELRYRSRTIHGATMRSGGCSYRLERPRYKGRLHWRGTVATHFVMFISNTRRRGGSPSNRPEVGEGFANIASMFSIRVDHVVGDERASWACAPPPGGRLTSIAQSLGRRCAGAHGIMEGSTNSPIAGVLPPVTNSCTITSCVSEPAREGRSTSATYHGTTTATSTGLGPTRYDGRSTNAATLPNQRGSASGRRRADFSNDPRIYPTTFV